MSKSNNTTKVATFISFVFTDGEEAWRDQISSENAHLCCGAETSRGEVAAVNSCTSVLRGDRVILRAHVGRSYDCDKPRKWVMTGRA